MLVVEDEWLVREVIVEQLAEHGFEVLEAATGEEALNHCSKCPSEKKLSRWNRL